MQRPPCGGRCLVRAASALVRGAARPRASSRHADRRRATTVIPNYRSLGPRRGGQKMRRPVLDRAWLEKRSPARWLQLMRLSGAILANALALLLAFFLGGEDEAAPMISFMAGVMAASWLGGRLVGLAAVAFS